MSVTSVVYAVVACFIDAFGYDAVRSVANAAFALDFSVSAVSGGIPTFAVRVAVPVFAVEVFSVVAGFAVCGVNVSVAAVPVGTGAVCIAFSVGSVQSRTVIACFVSVNIVVAAVMEYSVFESAVLSADLAACCVVRAVFVAVVRAVVALFFCASNNFTVRIICAVGTLDFSVAA